MLLMEKSNQNPEQILNRKLGFLHRAKTQLWSLACEYDGLQEDGMFVVFSDDNPVVELYDIAALAYFSKKVEG